MGFKAQLSASDVVYAITALLEATYFSQDPTENVQAEIKDQEGDGKTTRDEIWVKNFYKAFDALDECASFSLICCATCSPFFFFLFFFVFFLQC